MLAVTRFPGNDRMGTGHKAAKLLRVAAFTLCAAFFVSAPSHAEIKISGTGGDLGTWSMIANAYQRDNSGERITILPSLGSGGGILALQSGAIDIAISARPLTDEEHASGLEQSPYAVTALALCSANHKSIPTLTTRDLIEIYGEGARYWPDGKPMLVVLRPYYDSDTKIVSDAFPGMNEAFEKAEHRGARMASSDNTTADVLEETRVAIGFISLSLLLTEHRQLSIIALNGIKPSVETVANGTYPLIKTFYVTTRKDRQEQIQNLLAFLKSATGEAILHRTGHVPIQ